MHSATSCFPSLCSFHRHTPSCTSLLYKDDRKKKWNAVWGVTSSSYSCACTRANRWNVTFGAHSVRAWLKKQQQKNNKNTHSAVSVRLKWQQHWQERVWYSLQRRAHITEWKALIALGNTWRKRIYVLLNMSRGCAQSATTQDKD